MQSDYYGHNGCVVKDDVMRVCVWTPLTPLVVRLLSSALGVLVRKRGTVWKNTPIPLVAGSNKSITLTDSSVNTVL